MSLERGQLAEHERQVLLRLTAAGEGSFSANNASRSARLERRSRSEGSSTGRLRTVGQRPGIQMRGLITFGPGRLLGNEAQDELLPLRLAAGLVVHE